MQLAKTTGVLALTSIAFVTGHATGVAAPQEKMSSQEEMKAMEAAWDAMGKTGKMHELLEPFVGTWQAKATFWMPNGEEMTSTGTMKNSWIMDGRILQEEYTGDFRGQPFRGLGFWAYSNAGEEYQGLWMDSMSTHIDFTSGHEVSADGKTFTVNGEQVVGPGQPKVPYEDTLEVISENETRMTRKMQTPAGLVKSMEIIYTR